MLSRILPLTCEVTPGARLAAQVKAGTRCNLAGQHWSERVDLQLGAELRFP